jgi:hypothetical protein
MGSGFVFMMYLIFGPIVATAATLALRAWILSAEDPRAKPRRAVIIATILPWAGLVWMLGILELGSAADVRDQRDLGYGDDFYCPIPNGYEIEMIDLLEYAWLRERPRDHENVHVWGEEDGVLSGVIELQVEGPYILGGAIRSYEPFERPAKADYRFMIDTRSKALTRFGTEAELGKAAAAAGIQLKLEPMSRVYHRYRWTSFDRMIGYLIFIPPQLVFGMLLWWLYGLREAYRVRPPGRDAALAGRNATQST